MTLAATEPHQLVGYRLVRRLGSGSRAEVFLGRPEGEGEAVALKVFRSDVGLESIGSELGALERARSPHTVPLLDVATGPDGRPVAILGRVGRGSLARLVVERDALELGEAITVLAPIVATIAAMHRTGVVHSSVSATAVHFGPVGEPVLLGFGRAHLLGASPSIAALDREPLVAAERDRLARFVIGGLERSRPSEAAAAVIDLCRWLSSPRSTERFEFLDELQSRLFDLADPLPVRFGPTPAEITVPARVGGSADVPDQPPAGARHGRRRALASAVGSALEQAIVDSPRVAIGLRLRRVLGGVRRPVWVVFGAVATALVVALCLIPTMPASLSPGKATSAGAAIVVSASSDPRPDPTVRPSSRPDDPVDSVATLLQLRAGCIHDLSIGCLASADEPGAAAATEDAAAILAVRRGGEVTPLRPVDGVNASLVERIGDSALVSVGPKNAPALVLMIGTTAGWRIRSFVDASPRRP